MFALLPVFPAFSINCSTTRRLLPETMSLETPREHPLTTRPVTPNTSGRVAVFAVPVQEEFQLG
jgi:hypothetical protein